jgi:hypothetical protein
MAATAPSSANKWLDWAAEYTKAARAEARPPPEWAARVAAASAAAAGDMPWSAGLAEILAGALLSEDGGGAAAWKYAEAALAARLASPALLIALLSTRYVRLCWLGMRWGVCFRGLRGAVGRTGEANACFSANARSVCADVVHPKKFKGKLIRVLRESGHNAGSLTAALTIRCYYGRVLSVH